MRADLVSLLQFDANIFRFILYNFISDLYKNYMEQIMHLYYTSTSRHLFGLKTDK